MWRPCLFATRLLPLPAHVLVALLSMCWWLFKRKYCYFKRKQVLPLHHSATASLSVCVSCGLEDGVRGEGGGRPGSSTAATTPGPPTPAAPAAPAAPATTNSAPVPAPSNAATTGGGGGGSGGGGGGGGGAQEAGALLRMLMRTLLLRLSARVVCKKGRV
jgi:hypothetical protein